MSSPLRIHTPDGREHERECKDPDVILADWLETEHLPLNTRCGGRGLCRGCQVKTESGLERACQVACGHVAEIWIPDASLRDHRINGVSAFEIGSHRHRLRARSGIGLAIDIGTTTVAAALWDLKSGKCQASGSVANEQRRYGDNVLSRIDHAVAEGGCSPTLQKALVADSLEPLIEKLCQEAGIRPEAISESVAAGNTVMQHSIAGADLSGFAAYPFRPVFLESRTIDSTSVGFAHAFPLELASNLGPFVGADIAVGALASGMLESEGPALLIDFGTNGEILLKSGSGYLATATAAGPAFEGGRLRCGAAAGAGVISSLRRKGGTWKYRFVGEKASGRSTGIAGAAYIDFMQQALEAGILSPMGRFDPAHPEVAIAESGDERELRVALHQGLYVTEGDVAELMQAKAAIAAGVMTLLELAGLSPRDLETTYIAGGFGYHLDCRHAMAIGMIPAVDPARIRVVGNASLGGASLLLQSECHASIDALRQDCRVLELNQIESFEDHFIDCMPLESC